MLIIIGYIISINQRHGDMATSTLELQDTRQITFQIPFSSSKTIHINGGNYGGNHAFILTTTGNTGALMTAWLCLGLGERTTHHVAYKLCSNASPMISVDGGTTAGEYTISNSSTNTSCYCTLTVLQDAVGAGIYVT